MVLRVIYRDGGIRTRDPLNPIQVRYRTALRPANPRNLQHMRRFRARLPFALPALGPLCSNDILSMIQYAKETPLRPHRHHHPRG